jgi:hypothetical protein
MLAKTAGLHWGYFLNGGFRSDVAADYNALTGSWSTSASSGATKYMFEFKANRTVTYTFETKATDGQEYRASQKADKIVITSKDSNVRQRYKNWFEIRLPFQTDKLEITRFYESDNNSSSNTYVLTKQK